jgi:methylenetetrahydrofolate dehydrogenase (NADP+)/methenyltetrahydrofolate cyclohydrolase
MSAQIISGKAIAEDMLNSIQSRIDQRLSAGKRAPSLAVILVGADPASSI